MTSSATRKRSYFANMDGLRGLFFILVFLSHGCQHYDPQLQQHWLKPVVQFGAVHDHSLVMAFFFVMSSFLITLLLLRESHLQGRIHIGAFYLRRLLRIWPLYVLILGIGFGLYPWLRSFGSHAYTETARLPMYLLFLQNLDWAEHPPSFPGLGVLWSLAIEEQFYLVWPVLLAVVPRRALPYTLLAVLAAVLSWQATHSFRGFHTLTCASDLVVGGLAAVAVFAAQQRRHPLARRWLLAVRQQPAQRDDRDRDPMGCTWWAYTSTATGCTRRRPPCNLPSGSWWMCWPWLCCWSRIMAASPCLS